MIAGDAEEPDFGIELRGDPFVLGGLRRVAALVDEVAGDHDEGGLEAVGGSDGELEVDGLVLEARVLGEHPELRVGHLDEVLGGKRGRAGEGKEDEFHGFYSLSWRGHIAQLKVSGCRRRPSGRRRPVFSGADQLGDLPDVAQIVERPFVQHLRQGDLAVLLVHRYAIAGAGGKIAEELDVVLALLLEMIEGVLGVGIAIEIEIHLRVVGLELGTGPPP